DVQENRARRLDATRGVADRAHRQPHPDGAAVLVTELDLLVADLLARPELRERLLAARDSRGSIGPQRRDGAPGELVGAGAEQLDGLGIPPPDAGVGPDRVVGHGGLLVEVAEARLAFAHQGLSLEALDLGAAPAPRRCA